MKQKRLIWISLAGILLMAGTALFLFFQFIRPIGSGPAGPAVGREPFSGMWTTRPVMLVGLGDSVTAGFGARDLLNFGYNENHIVTAGYSINELVREGLSLRVVDRKGFHNA